MTEILNAGTVIPLGVCCMLLVGIVVFAMQRSRSRKRDDDDWEIRYDELEVGVHLGTGGFGEVYRATWKGTEVAVKVMASERITKDMERRFKDEVCLTPTAPLRSPWWIR
jgi:hypothetical protein